MQAAQEETVVPAIHQAVAVELEPQEHRLPMEVLLATAAMAFNLPLLAQRLTMLAVAAAMLTIHHLAALVV
jgi:hypothetical protein